MQSDIKWCCRHHDRLSVILSSCHCDTASVEQSTSEHQEQLCHTWRQLGREPADSAPCRIACAVGTTIVSKSKSPAATSMLFESSLRGPMPHCQKSTPAGSSGCELGLLCDPDVKDVLQLCIYHGGTWCAAVEAHAPLPEEYSCRQQPQLGPAVQATAAQAHCCLAAACFDCCPLHGACRPSTPAKLQIRAVLLPLAHAVQALVQAQRHAC